MKKWFHRLAIGLSILIALPVLFWLAGYLLPGQIVLKTERQVEAPANAVFELISTYDGLARWWEQAGEEMGDSFELRHLDGPRSGTGMVVGFYSADTLFETWTYTGSTAPQTVHIDVDFQIFRSSRTLMLSGTDEGTLFQWEEVAKVDAPHWRWLLTLGEEAAIANRQTVMQAAATAATAQNESP